MRRGCLATSLAIFFGHPSAKKSSGLPYYDLKYIACIGENQLVSKLFLVCFKLSSRSGWQGACSMVLFLTEFRWNNHTLVSSLSLTLLSSVLTALKWEMLRVHLGDRFVQYALQLHSLCTHQHRRLFFPTPRNAGMAPAVLVTGKVKSKRRRPGLQHLHLQISLGVVCLYFKYFWHNPASGCSWLINTGEEAWSAFNKETL